ncbi:hypothetical protein F4780DRAFT_450773 [Xylariomycetidae sp. FL0641]|nr:hypothetical protein F4780DRAFT_450773 [Xylariomycetidae sp. FL0641]
MCPQPTQSSSQQRPGFICLGSQCPLYSGRRATPGLSDPDDSLMQACRVKRVTETWTIVYSSVYLIRPLFLDDLCKKSHKHSGAWARQGRCRSQNRSPALAGTAGPLLARGSADLHDLGLLGTSALYQDAHRPRTEIRFDPLTAIWPARHLCTPRAPEVYPSSWRLVQANLRIQSGGDLPILHFRARSGYSAASSSTSQENGSLAEDDVGIRIH